MRVKYFEKLDPNFGATVLAEHPPFEVLEHIHEAVKDIPLPPIGKTYPLTLVFDTGENKVPIDFFVERIGKLKLRIYSVVTVKGDKEPSVEAIGVLEYPALGRRL